MKEELYKAIYTVSQEFDGIPDMLYTKMISNLTFDEILSNEFYNLNKRIDAFDFKNEIISLHRDAVNYRSIGLTFDDADVMIKNNICDMATRKLFNTGCRYIDALSDQNLLTYTQYCIDIFTHIKNNEAVYLEQLSYSPSSIDNLYLIDISAKCAITLLFQHIDDEIGKNFETIAKLVYGLDDTFSVVKEHLFGVSAIDGNSLIQDLSYSDTMNLINKFNVAYPTIVKQKFCKWNMVHCFLKPISVKDAEEIQQRYKFKKDFDDLYREAQSMVKNPDYLILIDHIIESTIVNNKYLKYSNTASIISNVLIELFIDSIMYDSKNNSIAEKNKYSEFFEKYKTYLYNPTVIESVVIKTEAFANSEAGYEPIRRFISCLSDDALKTFIMYYLQKCIDNHKKPEKFYNFASFRVFYDLYCRNRNIKPVDRLTKDSTDIDYYFYLVTNLLINIRPSFYDENANNGDEYSIETSVDKRLEEVFQHQYIKTEHYGYRNKSTALTRHIMNYVFSPTSECVNYTTQDCRDLYLMSYYYSPLYFADKGSDADNEIPRFNYKRYVNTFKCEIYRIMKDEFEYDNDVMERVKAILYIDEHLSISPLTTYRRVSDMGNQLHMLERLIKYDSYGDILKLDRSYIHDLIPIPTAGVSLFISKYGDVTETDKLSVVNNMFDNAFTTIKSKNNDKINTFLYDFYIGTYLDDSIFIEKYDMISKIYKDYISSNNNYCFYSNNEFAKTFKDAFIRFYNDIVFKYIEVSDEVKEEVLNKISNVYDQTKALIYLTK